MTLIFSGATGRVVAAFVLAICLAAAAVAQDDCNKPCDAAPCEAAACKAGDCEASVCKSGVCEAGVCEAGVCAESDCDTTSRRPVRGVPLAFDLAAPETSCNEKCFTAVTCNLCGHVCDGDRCYETEDSPVAATSVASDPESIRIADAAPPMPTLRRAATRSVEAIDSLPTAQVELQPPTEDRTPTPTAIDDVDGTLAHLKAQLKATTKQLRIAEKHHRQMTVMSELITELKVENALLHAKIEQAQEQFEARTEMAALQAELAAAKEWIGQRLAADAVAGSEHHYVTSRPSAVDLVCPNTPKPRPVPFAFGSYQPIEGLIDAKSSSDPVKLHCLEKCDGESDTCSAAGDSDE